MAHWFRNHTGAVNQLAIEQLRLQSTDRLLEIGFGGGDLLFSLLTGGTPAHAAGIDLSSVMLKRVRSRLRRFIQQGRVEIGLGSVDDIPYANATFTRIVSVNTLYFWPDPALALTECRRVLADGGKFILCFDAKEELQRWPGHVHGFRLYEPAEVEILYRAAGFAPLTLATRLIPGYGKVYCLTAQAI